MNNLVDLSSIHHFTSFNNIKQIGGGKIFYYIDEKGNRTERVDPNLSRAINHHLESDEFTDMSFVYFQTDNKDVYLYRKPTGEIFGELNRLGQASKTKKFIAIDQSSAAAGDKEELESKPDRHDTRPRATSSSAAAGEELESARPDTRLRASAALAEAEPVSMNVIYHQPITSINSILIKDKEPLVYYKKKYIIRFMNGEEAVYKILTVDKFVSEDNLLIFFKKIYPDAVEVSHNDYLIVFINYNYDSKDIISIEKNNGEDLVIIPIENSDDSSNDSSDDSSYDSSYDSETERNLMKSDSGPDDSGSDDSWGGYYPIYFHHCY